MNSIRCMTFILTFFIMLNVTAKTPFHLIKTANKDVPYIIQLMVEHLDSISISKESGRKMITSMKMVNENLKRLDRVNTIFLATSEGYKSLLNYKFDVIISRNAIMTSQIVMIKNKLKKNDAIYTSFSKFIITSILEDFDEFLVGNFLTKYQNKTSSDSRNYKKIQQLKKIVKYSGPWIHAISSNPPTAFNQMLGDVIKTFLANFAEQSKIFSFNQKTNSKRADQIIFSGLDSLEVTQYLKSSTQSKDQIPEITVQDNAKSEAESTIKDLNVQDPKLRSKDIKNLMKQIYQNR